MFNRSKSIEKQYTEWQECQQAEVLEKRIADTSKQQAMWLIGSFLWFNCENDLSLQVETACFGV